MSLSLYSWGAICILLALSSINSREQILKFVWHPLTKPLISQSKYDIPSLLSFLSKVNSIKAVWTGVQTGLSGDFPLIISKTFQPRECNSVSSRYRRPEDCIALVPRLDYRAAHSVCECLIQQAQLVCFLKWKVCTKSVSSTNGCIDSAWRCSTPSTTMTFSW